MNSFVATLQQLGPARLGIMGAIILGLLTFLTFVSVRVSSPPMKLLYSDLSSEDSSAVAAKLEETDIPYEVSSDGARVLVSADNVGRARMLLAAEGLPNGGSMGYEIFDKQSGFGTTDFVQNINQVRALEGELSRTISSLDNIRSARVHIVLPQREVFSRETRASSASVFVNARPGGQIEKEQVLAIQSLISSAVPNLKASEVSIIDSNGHLLARGGGEATDLMTLKAEELRRGYEEALMRKIEEQVSRVVGFGNVTAVVTAEMNFDKVSTNEELYDPEGQVLRSSQIAEETNNDREQQNDQTGIEQNLPGLGQDDLAGATSSSETSRREETSNYEINKTVRNTVSEAGEIKKLFVSVVVDGRYTKNEDGTQTYTPRTQQEMDQISALIRSAAGLDDSRGDTLEVANLQFVQPETTEIGIDERYLMGFEKSDLVDAAEIIVVSIMVILIVVLVLQPMVSRLMAMESGGDASSSGITNDMRATDLLTAPPRNPALAPPGTATSESMGMMGSDDGGASENMINVAGIEGKVKASTLKKVEEIVDAYPNETVSVIRSWMSQEG